ncbi:hypothetical protein MTR_0053s0080 [Medicago truncatula]|uniref:Uncharacterized protein n=1 Tax=Medicago truncatula TaxID=3880 RepID=A0A072TIH5_MEDTR|nr:hypothetical protein MTR_0053s0080 [Medicago truncatula]
MANHDGFNLYNQVEYEPYQQYQQYPSEDERISNMENILNLFMQQSMIIMQDTNQRLKNLSCQMEKMQLQLSDIDIQLSNRLLHEKRTDVSTENEEVSEIGVEGVDQTEEGETLDGCGETESAKEIEMPHKEEFPQERPYTEEAETVENEEVMEVTEKKERILSKEESMEGKGKKVNKVEIDRIIDEICVVHFILATQVREDMDSTSAVPKVHGIPPKVQDYKRSCYNYDISEAGREYWAQYKFMTNEAKIIQKFILYNVMPNSHLSDCVVEVCPLIYYILKGIKVDIARTIAWELRMVTLQGRGEREARLSFPGLIMGLIKDAGMRLPTSVHEKIRNPINDAFITRYIFGETKKDKGKGKQASSSQAPHPHPGPEPF